MDFRAIVRRIDGSTEKYDVTGVDSLEHAFQAIRAEDPNARTALVLIINPKRKDEK